MRVKTNLSSLFPLRKHSERCYIASHKSSVKSQVPIANTYSTPFSSLWFFFLPSHWLILLLAYTSLSQHWILRDPNLWQIGIYHKSPQVESGGSGRAGQRDKKVGQEECLAPFLTKSTWWKFLKFSQPNFFFSGLWGACNLALRSFHCVCSSMVACPHTVQLISFPTYLA